MLKGLKPFILLALLLSGLCLPGAPFLNEARSAGSKKPTWWIEAEKDAAAEGYGLLTVDEMKILYDSGKPALIMDVRPDYEYSMGRLPQAVNLEFHLGDRIKLAPERKERLLKILGPDKTRRIVIYCRSYS